jgi:glucans biosynthesis protein
VSLTCNRRRFLGATAAGALLSGMASPAWRAVAGPAELDFLRKPPVSFESLAVRARDLAGRDYLPVERPDPAVVEQIDYDAHGKLKFRPELALYAEGPSVYPITFFHIGRFFPKKVAMYALSDDAASEILYHPDYFDMPADSVAHSLPDDVGFAGFRLQESRRRDDWKTQDWVAFLGASYFRAIGELNQYGLSARGITIDTAVPGPEEFPDFVEFYFLPAATEKDPAIVLALLDGPSIAGAYRFQLWRTKGVIMEVEAQLFLRRDVQRLGIAPLTSMFWYAEQNRGAALDWRPEIHDSDGLALWTGSGERLWRPLNNPSETTTSSFTDENPRGFGLLQRDRNFEHYLDGVNYDRRPSLWVEPLGNWGKGAVQLVEIPTDDEIHDNIGAFWVPAEPARAGASYELRYRLHWLADEPYPPESLARCVATRTGRGGEPGKPRVANLDKFVIEFSGGEVDKLDQDAEIDAVIDASRGEISNIVVEPVADTGRWRIQFDLDAGGAQPVELRAYLRAGDRALTETWLYQHRWRAQS